MDNSSDREFSLEEIDEARKIFAGACDFVMGVAQLGQLPPATLSEIAFAGRSNVGKSSLVNALTGRKTLARTSNTPGRTQELNYFNLGGHLFMVDMPGYGYAKVSKEKVSDWTNLIYAYLRGRQTLRCVLILIDSRHSLKSTDLDLMKMLDETAVSYRIVLTKTDKVKTQELDKVITDIEQSLKKHPAAYPYVMKTSSVENQGIAELRATILSIARS